MQLDYKTIGKHLQLEGDRINADADFLEQQGIKDAKAMNRQDGIDMFNQIAQENGLNPLQDPLGYMTLDDNLYDNIHDQYKEQYSQAAGMIDDGMMDGGSYGMNSVLNKINPTIRHDMTPFMPDKMKYSDLRFVKATPDLKKSVNSMVSTRVKMTYSFGIKRKVEPATLQGLQDRFKQQGQALGQQIANSKLQNQRGQAGKRNVLSMNQLLANSGNNKDALADFKTKLMQPDEITKAAEDEHAKASFTTSDKSLAKFMLKNKKYLNDFGFDVKKASGQITTSWQSDTVDKQYAQQQNEPEQVNIDLSGIEEENTHDQTQL